jgi:hypothetical protein
MSKNLLQRLSGLTLSILFLSSAVFAQQRQATLRGLVADQLGGAIVGATVTLSDASGQKRTAVTNAEGIYTFNALLPGEYSVRASSKGFADAPDKAVTLKAGERQSVDLSLKVTIEEQKVTIGSDTGVSTETGANANQTLITGKDLDSLPDDPDELAAALQALAGPQIGPEGGQILLMVWGAGCRPRFDSRDSYPSKPVCARERSAIRTD